MAAKQMKKGLGRGLDALMESVETQEHQGKVLTLSVYEIDTNPDQPRKTFDEEKLAELAESIRRHGIVQPLVVAPKGQRYIIVAGERRFRAARLAGLSTVPCIVRDLTNEQQMEAALIENLQRQDLNPIEEASAIRSLMDECGYTQEQAAQKLGKSRPAIANTLRLLTLPKQVLTLVQSGELSAGHARVLAGLDSAEQQIALARRCVSESLSVRKLEELAREEPAAPAVKKSAAPRPLTPELHTLQDTMRQALGLKTVLTGNEKKGKITLSYNSSEELEHLYEVVGRLTE